MTTPIIRIPSEDLTRQYQEIKLEIAAAIDTVLPSGKYTMGPVLEKFEQEFAEYCGTKYCVGISNGTEALHLALVAMGVGPGDEVITQANTYVATSFAINYAGAVPIFVDVDPVYYNMDPNKLEEKITARTKVIIPVHMYGQLCDMEAINKIASRHHLQVLEDGSHAHGATYKSRKAGSFGNAAAMSFYPSKVLGAYGDGGAILTDDEELYKKIRILRYMGQEVKHTHQVIGFQQRLDPMQAAILSVKLRHLDGWIEKRRAIADRYRELLSDLPVETPKEAPSTSHVYYLYTIHCEQRDALANYLTDKGIEIQKIYATPVPLQPCYQYLEYQESDIPIASKHSHELLCLPVFPELRDEEIRQVSDAIHEFYADHKQRSRA
jgi:dTDP-4-amino-4,6-dideoxygalactose transaminase